MSHLCVRAHEIREASEHICRKAVSAQERAQENVLRSWLSRQRRLAEREVILCGEILTGSLTAV